MRILYLISAISTDNTGRGGHYESLKTIAGAISKKNPNILVVCMGDIYPPTFKITNIPFIFADVRSVGVFGMFQKIDKIINNFSPEIIHSFDNKSYFIARFFSLIKGTRLVLTKPGGPNPKHFFPYCDDLIVFSRENEIFFKKKNILSGAQIHFLPNRVGDLWIDNVRINELKKRYAVSGTVVLRIARISKKYHESIIQTINLSRRLRDDGFNVTCIILGYVQDIAVLEELKSRYGNNFIVVTDDYFTTKASELLTIADIVVGSGRGVMEAALMDRLVFSTVANSEYPVFIDDKTFENLFDNNFSPRSKAQQAVIENSLVSATNLLRAGKKGNIKKIANKYFDVGFVLDKYYYIYSESKRQSYWGVGNVLLNLLVFFWFYRRFIKR